MKPVWQQVSGTIPRRSLLLHPLCLFLLSWLSVTLLYMMHLSRLLIFDNGMVIQTALWIIVPYVVFIACWDGVRALMRAPSCRKEVAFSIDPAVLQKIDRTLRRAFWTWLLLTVVEIAVSGGVPILWLIRGSSKTYFDFGIPSVHGFLNALLLAIALCQVGLCALDGKKRRLLVPGFVLLWTVVVVTRNLMIVLLIESGIVWGVLRGISWRALQKSLVIVAALILVFGYIGDFRSGAENFRELAQPADEYPTWLPSGVLWVYIYLTTPIGNIVNTAVYVTPSYSALFPNTTSLLFPTVLRQIIYGKAAAAEAFGGNLVTDAFNVSTAYVGPFQDYGVVGIVCFSVLLALIARASWGKQTLLGVIVYAVIGQCVVLSIFFNHLFFLPVVSQIPWLYLFLRKVKQIPGKKDGVWDFFIRCLGTH